MSQLSPSTQEIRVTLTLEASTSLNKPEIQDRFAKIDLGHTLDLLNVHVQEEAELYGNDPELAQAVDEIESSFPESKICALATFLGVPPDDIHERDSKMFGETVYLYDEREFLILTDEEADAAVDWCFDDWIVEEFFRAIKEEHRHYVHFDEEAWKENALIDGRGHHLASYDGNEHEQGQLFPLPPLLKPDG